MDAIVYFGIIFTILAVINIPDTQQNGISTRHVLLSMSLKRRYFKQIIDSACRYLLLF
ncbi:MAG: hypothetical protein JAY60_09965 [Candidatus Thiodiazotropha weberae]|nr:hypothetical protein [Candidatus Thiodiazotropha weberae]